MNFWKSALKYHAPATISGFIFFYLVSALLGSENLLRKNPILSIFILLVIANFCAFLLYRTTTIVPNIIAGRINVSDNEISENEVDGSLKITMNENIENVQEVTIQKNSILKNKIKGDLVIGVTKNNGQ